MHLGQIKSDGVPLAAVFEGGRARPIPAHNTLDLIRRAEAQGEPLARLAAQLASRHPEPLEPLLPIHPPEVWGCECTYPAGGATGDAGHGRAEGVYVDLRRGTRPGIFFKGTARVCVGTGQAIGIRPDSRFTAAEPELAVVLGRRGRVAAYTLANDVCAWDIERENPLYLSQSKTYDACCALGPVMLTADDLPDPYRLEMTCTVAREGREIFSETVSTAALQRRIETLLEFLMRANRVPAGSVVLTGTGIILPERAALAAGDVVTIRIPEIGELVNRAALIE